MEAYGDYWYKIENRLQAKDDCQQILEKVIKPQQLRQSILDSLHLAHPGAAATIDLCENNWFPHIQRTILQIAEVVYVG